MIIISNFDRLRGNSVDIYRLKSYHNVVNNAPKGSQP